MDKAGKDYWAKVWDNSGLPDLVDPASTRLSNYVNRQFHKLFRRVFPPSNEDARVFRLVEVGCARSVWLPYFAREHGFLVSGIDYCGEGCDQARALLEKAGVTGEIACSDLFAPPSEFRDAHDAVISFGVAEHFEKTEECVRGFASLAKPGGLIVTIIPNMVGCIGRLQRLADRAVFDIHVPLDREQLAKAHQAANLTVLECEYFLPANFGVVNLESWSSSAKYRLACRVRSAASKAFWAVDRLLPLPPNRWLSPYIVAVARK